MGSKIRILIAAISILLIAGCTGEAYRSGSLSINSAPTGASVFINGMYKGVTPFNISAVSGTYKIVISKAGYKNYTTSVIILPGSVKKIMVTLNQTAAGNQTASTQVYNNTNIVNVPVVANPSRPMPGGTNYSVQ